MGIIAITGHERDRGIWPNKHGAFARNQNCILGTIETWLSFNEATGFVGDTRNPPGALVQASSASALHCKAQCCQIASSPHVSSKAMDRLPIESDQLGALVIQMEDRQATQQRTVNDKRILFDLATTVLIALSPIILLADLYGHSLS